MNPFGARRHLSLGTSIGAGWDVDPRWQGGEWETCGKNPSSLSLRAKRGSLLYLLG
jgi:hypothetical protein